MADGFSGDILEFWKKSIFQVTPIFVSREALHIVISSEASKNFIVSVIYNSHHFHIQCLL